MFHFRTFIPLFVFGIYLAFCLVNYIKSFKNMSNVYRILCYGDSLTAGYHSFGMIFSPYGSFLDKQLGREAEVTSVGYSGWTTSQMLDSVEEEEVHDLVGRPWPGLKTELRRQAYNLSIVMGGTNDLGHGHSADMIAGNLISLINIMKDFNISRVISIGIPDSAFQMHSSSARARRDQVNERLRNFAASSGGFVKYYPCPVEYKPGSHLFESDGLHFSEKGYETLGNFLFPKVKKIVEGTNN